MEKLSSVAPAAATTSATLTTSSTAESDMPTDEEILEDFLFAPYLETDK
jgi:hypothetical protein